MCSSSHITQRASLRHSSLSNVREIPSWALTAAFNNKRTLKFKCVFCYRQSIVRRLLPAFGCARRFELVIALRASSRKLGAAVHLMVAKNAFVGWALNLFLICLFLLSFTTNTLQHLKYLICNDLIIWQKKCYNTYKTLLGVAQASQAKNTWCKGQFVYIENCTGKSPIMKKNV